MGFLGVLSDIYKVKQLQEGVSWTKMIQNLYKKERRVVNVQWEKSAKYIVRLVYFTIKLKYILLVHVKRNQQNL